MKNTTKLLLALTSLFLGGASLTWAIVTTPFQGWEQLEQRSGDIVIARCEKTPDLFELETNGVIRELPGGLIKTEIKIISVLKGGIKKDFPSSKNTDLYSTRLVSWYQPRQNEYYLIFSTRLDGEYQAPEAYKIVPLGLQFSTNMISGKPLNEQIQTLLRLRLNHLNRQMKLDADEKQRLETGLK